jgi:glycosyltransferase involved in cell wall biosynthesis
MSESHLIVPCFNEASRLQTAEFARLVALRPELTVMFVDDGSTDGTSLVVGALRREAGERIILHRLDRNMGKGEAVRRGLRLALERGASVVGFADADLSTPIAELCRMLDRMDAGGMAVLFGSRVRLLGTAIERQAHRHYLGRVFATFASLALGIPVYDTQCGAKLFRRTPILERALEAPFSSRWIFDVELIDRLLRGAGAAAPLVQSDFEEIPLREWRDVAGSKLRLASMVQASAQILALFFRRRLLPWRRHAGASVPRLQGRPSPEVRDLAERRGPETRPRL